MKQFYAEYNKKLNTNAKKLRKDMTDQERKLWYLFLKDYPIRILRQKIIHNSILDFYCAKAKLGIEIIRISNMDINKHFKSVCEYIDDEINKRI